MPPWRNGIRGRLRACARKGVVVRVHSGAPTHDVRRSRQADTHVAWLSGRLAQPEEHLVYTERVRGSSPLPPTSIVSLVLARAHTVRPYKSSPLYSAPSASCAVPFFSALSASPAVLFSSPSVPSVPSVSSAVILFSAFFVSPEGGEGARCEGDLFGELGGDEAAALGEDRRHVRGGGNVEVRVARRHARDRGRQNLLRRHLFQR